MPPRTLAPIGSGNVQVTPPVDSTQEREFETTTPGVRTLAPIQAQPFKPPVNDTGTFRQNLESVQADPAFFDDIGRVSSVEIAGEIVRAGQDVLEDERGKRVARGLGAIHDYARTIETALSITPQGEFTKETLGVVETVGKTLINFFGEGFSSAAALWEAAGTVGPSLEISGEGVKVFNDPRSFSDAYISAQGAIAAAHGRFYDYTPLLETTDRDIEKMTEFMEGTVGASGNYLGQTTLDATDSPLLAAGAKMIPDAVLMAIPFIPKAVRSLRQSRQVTAFEAELEANLRSKIEEEGLFVETIDEFAGTKPTEVVAGTGLSGQSTRIRNAKGEIVGDVRATEVDGHLQITSSAIDESLRGKGLGVEMYENMIARAAARGYPTVTSDAIVSEAAANVYESLGRRGYRVEKNPTAQLETTEAITMAGEEAATVSKGGTWTTTDGGPVYRIILDEPAATSTLTPTRMKVQTLNVLRGEAPLPDSALVADLAEQLRAGKGVGDIIVETVQGTPVKILSGVETLEALQVASQRAGLNLRNVVVKLQERQALAPNDIAALETQARAGMSDILENQRKLEITEQAGNRSIIQKLIHMFADTSGNVKAEILRTMGAAGEAAVREFSLKAGAVPKAHMMFQDFHRMVYGSRGSTDPGLNFRRSINHLGETVSEVDLFNILVQSRRTQAIVKSGGARASQAGKFQLAGAVRPENAAGNIWAIRKTLGEARFAQLTARADQVFETMHNQLVRLRDNGIITQSQFLRMQNIDYIRREFVEGIDPVMLQAQLRGSKVSIGESGIYHLKGGSTRAQNIDVQSLVAEYLARTEGRIFRNNANRALLQAAKESPDNGLVILPKSPGTKVPEGFSELKVMVDGEPTRMFMKDLYAAEWIVNDPGINMAIANFFRIINGTFVVKPLATGMNPAFALVNFPRDIMHAWKATGNEYSAFLPRYLGQISRDIWEVRKDVWNKDGVYREFIDDGGGMNFLTHGGFDPLTGFNRSKDLMRTMGVYQGNLGRWWNQTKEILSKVNEFSELAVRLAIRQRVLRNQARRGQMPDRRQATFIARDYLDFSQGGSATKAIESFLPYSNAAAQAIRTAVRQYGRGPQAAGVAVLKDLQVVTMKAAQSSWAWMEHPEVMAQVDPHQMYTTQVYPTGLHFTDDRGNTRHVTLQVSMDTTTLPFTAIFDRAISKHALLATGIDPNDIPSDHFLSEIASVVPILSQIRTGTPTFQALAALASNKDIWANRDIWTGDPYVMPGARRNENTEGTIYDALGLAFPEVVSPVQLQKAWRTYVPSNFYIDSADFIRKQIQNSQDPIAQAEMMNRETSDITLELLSQVPGLNRVIHLTHPAAQTSPELRMLAQNVATWREIERQAVDAAVRKHLVMGDSGDFAKLLESVASVRPQDAERVKDLLVTKIAVDTMYKENKYDIGFVGQDWFNLLAGQNAETRAELYYWKHVSLSDENAANLQAVVAQIDKVGGRRIWTDEFQQHLASLISQYGTREERLRAVMGSAN